MSFILGDSGNNLLIGTNGDDTIDGGAGNDTIDGGAGNDTASYASATGSFTLVNLLLSGPQKTYGGGDDTLVSIENLLGSSLPDFFYGDDGDNVLTGAGGADNLTGGGGNDTLDGGPGNDFARYQDAPAGVVVNLTIAGPQDTHGDGVDTLISIENLAGSAFDDVLTGDAQDNFIDGGAGNDTIIGSGGNDIIQGGLGTDTLTYAASSVGVVVADQGVEIIIGSSYDDNLSGGYVLQGGAGDDSLAGGLVPETIDGGPGQDTVNYARSVTGVFIDLRNPVQVAVLGTPDILTGIENVTGSSVGDNITGDDGNNVIAAGGGADLIMGAGGDDTIDGGAGDDTAFYRGPRSAYSLNISGHQATVTDLGSGYSDGTDSLTDVEHLRFSDQVLNLVGPSAAADLTGDTGADILWRNTVNGDLYLWTSRLNAAPAPGHDFGLVELQWKAELTDDFNGDGKADILWRNLGNGDAYLWTSSANGLAAPGLDLGIVELQWSIQGAADFDGDRRADILWRNGGNGDVYVFTSSATGVAAPGQDLGIGPLECRIEGTADFNGDGKADILWRDLSSGDVYLWKSSFNGLAAPGLELPGTGIHGNDLGVVGLQWQVEQTDDFDGDGKADILWRNYGNGDVYLWTSSASVTGIARPGVDLGIMGLNWVIETAADFDNDGKADILWRDTNTGDVVVWTSAGHAIATPGLDLGIVAPSWSVI